MESQGTFYGSDGVTHLQQHLAKDLKAPAAKQKFSQPASAARANQLGMLDGLAGKLSDIHPGIIRVTEVILGVNALLVFISGIFSIIGIWFFAFTKESQFVLSFRITVGALSSLAIVFFMLANLGLYYTVRAVRILILNIKNSATATIHPS